MNDPIDRQAAIAAIDAIAAEVEDGEGFDYEKWREYFRNLPPAQQWFPCSDRIPENEQDILATVEVRTFWRTPYRKVVRAFYTDGHHTDIDSAYSWNDIPNPQYDDNDNLIIPEGWWESSDYYEQQGMVDDFVVAWMPSPEPYKGE